MTQEEDIDQGKKRLGVSRREFIAGTVGGVVVGAVVGAAAGSLGFPKTITQTTTQTQTQTTTSVTTAQPWLPAKWDYTADVVVVGFGGAGAVAAINAANAGAKVLVLEKMPEQLAGGNTGVAGGAIFTPSPASEAVIYLNAMADGYPIPQDMVQTWAQQMGENATWLKSIGGNPVDVDNTTVTPSGYSAAVSFVPEFGELPGADCAHVFRDGVAPGRGVNHFAFLKSVVQQKSNITVMYQTRATSLVQSGATKEILGVTATANFPNPLTVVSPGSVGASGAPAVTVTSAAPATINVKASKAVILALGGFENNAQMLRDYLQLPNGAPEGTPANTGDGIPMVKAVGAALWHMDNMAGGGLGMLIPALPNGPGMTLTLGANNYVYIGSDGNRFVNESISTRHGKIPFNYTINPTPNANTRWIPFPTPFPIYAIFDETVMKAGPISSVPNTTGGMGYNIVHANYTWSNDNSLELSNGWITKANTIQDLATSINMDPTTLSKTVAAYNGYCQAGVDAQFGRAKATMAPIQTPPYYAVSLAYLLLNTQGGAKRNAKAQVVDDDNNPIPRLYSAGEFGSIYSWCYNGGGNIGETIAFGTIAGQNAAAETAWS